MGEKVRTKVPKQEKLPRINAEFADCFQSYKRKTAADSHGFSRIFYQGFYPCRSVQIRGFVLLVLLTASRRDDPIHPQIFHHLTVMVKRVCGRERTSA